MGLPAHRVGDMAVGHGCFPPTTAIKGCTTVFVNGMPLMNVGGMHAPHCCPKAGCHPPVMAKGSATVKANGTSACRISDKAGCGSTAMTGSGNVFIGG